MPKHRKRLVSLSFKAQPVLCKFEETPCEMSKMAVEGPWSSISNSSLEGATSKRAPLNSKSTDKRQEILDQIDEILHGKALFDTVGQTFELRELPTYINISDLKEVLGLLQKLRNDTTAEVRDIREFVFSGLLNSIENAAGDNPHTASHLVKHNGFYIDIAKHAHATHPEIGQKIMNAIEQKLVAYADILTDTDNVRANIFYPDTYLVDYKPFLSSYRAYEKVQKNFFDGGFSLNTHKIREVEALHKLDLANPYKKMATGAPYAFDPRSTDPHLAEYTISFLGNVKALAPEYLHVFVDAIVDRAKENADKAFEAPETVSDLRELKKNAQQISQFLDSVRDISHVTGRDFDREFFKTEDHFKKQSELNTFSSQSEEAFFRHNAGGFVEPIDLAPGYTYDAGRKDRTSLIRIDMSVAKAGVVGEDGFPPTKPIEERIIEANPFGNATDQEYAVASVSGAHFISQSGIVDNQNVHGESARPSIRDGKVVHARPGDGNSGKLDDYLDQIAIVIKKDGSFSLETVRSTLKSNRFGSLVRDANGEFIPKSDIKDVIIGTHIPNPNSEKSFFDVQQASSNLVIEYQGFIYLYQAANSKFHTFSDIKQILGLPYDAEFGTGEGKVHIAILDPGRSNMQHNGIQFGNTPGDVQSQDILDQPGVVVFGRNVLLTQGAVPNPVTLHFFAPIPK